MGKFSPGKGQKDLFHFVLGDTAPFVLHGKPCRFERDRDSPTGGISHRIPHKVGKHAGSETIRKSGRRCTGPVVNHHAEPFLAGIRLILFLNLTGNIRQIFDIVIRGFDILIARKCEKHMDQSLHSLCGKRDFCQPPLLLRGKVADFPHQLGCRGNN